MPVIAGSVQTAPPPVHLPGVGFATATFTGPDGMVWPLTDEAAGWFTLADGVSGLDVTSYDLTKDAYPRGGSRLRHAQPADRTIIWPLIRQHERPGPAGRPGFFAVHIDCNGSMTWCVEQSET